MVQLKHWLALLAGALLVAPKVAAVIVRRHLEVEQLKFDINEYRLTADRLIETNFVCMDAMRGAIWKEQERRARRRHR